MMAQTWWLTQDELTDLEWLRLAPDLEPGSFLRAEDGSNMLDPTGQCVVFVKEGCAQRSSWAC